MENRPKKRKPLVMRPNFETILNLSRREVIRIMSCMKPDEVEVFKSETLRLLKNDPTVTPNRALVLGVDAESLRQMLAAENGGTAGCNSALALAENRTQPRRLSAIGRKRTRKERTRRTYAGRRRNIVTRFGLLGKMLSSRKAAAANRSTHHVLPLIYTYRYDPGDEAPGDEDWG